MLKDCSKKIALKLSGSMTVIGESAFSGCTELTSITIPEGITKIDSSAFYGCTGLTEVKLPASINEIEENPFSNCVNLTRLTVNDGNSKYKSESNVVYDNTEKKALFAAKGVTGSITILDGVTAIGESAFSYCTKLTNVTIPKSLTSIAVLTFNGCTALTQVEFPENAALTTIEKSAFDGCINLTTIAIPNNVTTIGDSTFVNCRALKTVHIGNKVEHIGWAFSGCTKAEITLPESITTINSGAFGLDTSSYCKKVRIKSGTHYDRIEKLVKDSGYPANRIEKY